METKLERIAVKAKKETKLRFTSLTHHITKEMIWKNLVHMQKGTATGIDSITVGKAIKEFDIWAEKMINSIHLKNYNPPAIGGVWILKPGKDGKRHIGVSGVADRALQRSTAEVLEAIYEQDFLDCSFGGRPGKGFRYALATLNKTISSKKVSWVLEADLKNFFGSLNHIWLLKFLGHRIGDPRIISMISRWLKAGVMEDGKLEVIETGTPQSGSISLLLSNIYLHYALDLWFEKIVKPSLKGEAYIIRYIDDFFVCFQYRSEAYWFYEGLEKRLNIFFLRLDANKTRLVESSRYVYKRKKHETSVSLLPRVYASF